MDKNAIKKYAIWARRELIERVSQRALLYGISADAQADANAVIVNGQALDAVQQKQRKALIEQIKEKGYEQVMEEVAYTWFNRFAALRFMEVNGYLPSHIRVFTDDDGAFRPQILTEAIHLDLDGLDMEKVYALERENKKEELFKYLLIVQCNALSGILPGMFQKIEDYTELLLPDYLLREGSVIEQMVTMIPEEDWTDQVQIIGWLYQYYNTEPKDRVFADLKKNIKISKEKIPAATQLFTPDWIVHYMVENSLGRLWIERKQALSDLASPIRGGACEAGGGVSPEKQFADSMGWKYYLEEAEQEPEVEAQLAEIRKEYAALKPEEILCIDPCMGSGHILCVLFDVLVRIYEDYGYTAREAAVSIVQNNLWGLDIDERAAQLAYFAVMMKARQYDRRFFSRHIQPHVYAIAESNHVNADAVGYFCNGDEKLEHAMQTIITELHDAKEYGSILTTTPQDWDALYARFDEIRDDISIYKDTALALEPLVQTAQALGQKYWVTVTNPPYMGSSNMNPKLAGYIKKYYADYKSDFFSAFIVRCSNMVTDNGRVGMFTPYVWMFIQSYENLRNFLYGHAIETLIQFEYSAFEEATVPVCTFAFGNHHVADKKGTYLRLTEFRGGMEVQRQKTLRAIADHSCGYYYEQSADNFSKIPGSPVAYWVSEKTFSAFKGPFLGSACDITRGLTTGNNELFLRAWYEINNTNFSRSTCSVTQTVKSEIKWYPHNKGGDFRKWYGNNELVVDFRHGGISLREFYKINKAVRFTGIEYYFKPGITWTALTSSANSFRYSNYHIFDSNKGPMLFASDERLYYILGYLNSKITNYFIKLLNPSLSLQNADMNNLPYFEEIENIHQVKGIVDNNISLSREDWDSFETSWDFQRQPMLSVISKNRMLFDDISNIDLAECYICWADECEERFQALKSNEEELNRIFIDIYGLQDELTPDVADKDVTVRRFFDSKDDIPESMRGSAYALTKQDAVKSLISYAVGCMFGRYSLDEEGLAYAGGEWDASKYKTFPADKDAIIPICDDEYFTDDIVGLFVKFIKTVYGTETLEENLRFIADALDTKGSSSREIIRNYFLNDFYKDHLKTYQKRPIYWLFDSGKKNGFKCLIYMHRYQPDTIARIRTDYVHEQQSRYRTAIADLEQRVNNASASERVKLNKQLQKLQGQSEEVRVYEEKIHHLADQFIAIDLDDSVKVNYAKFQDVLAKIK